MAEPPSPRCSCSVRQALTRRLRRPERSGLAGERAGAGGGQSPALLVRVFRRYSLLDHHGVEPVMHNRPPARGVLMLSTRLIEPGLFHPVVLC